MIDTYVRFAALRVLMCCVCICTASAQVHDGGIDTLILKNGDRLSGRLAKANSQTVELDSSALGLLAVPWAQISQVQSRNRRWRMEERQQTNQAPYADFHNAVLQNEEDAIVVKVDSTVVSLAGEVSMTFVDQEHPAAGPQTQGVKVPSPPPDSSVFISLNAPESVVDGSQSQVTLGGSFRVLHNEPDLCKPVSWFSALELAANHNRTYKVKTPAIVTDTYDGTVSLKNGLTSTSKVTGYVIADLFGNSSLGIGLQQSYGGGLSGVLFSNGCNGVNPRLPKHYRLSINGDAGIRYIHQRLYAPSGPLDLAGMRFSEGLVYVPLFTAKDGSQKDRFEIDESIWVTPMLNNARAIQAGGSVALSVPVSKGLSVSLTEEDDFINNAPKAKRKNYLKSGVTVTYTFPAPQTSK